MKIRDENIIEHKKDRDCLYFKMEDGVYCLTPWEADFGCYRWQDQHWRQVVRLPELRLLFAPPRYRKPCRLRSEFINRIPPNIRQIAQPFQWLQIALLRLMRYTDIAIDLAHSNLPLLWLMADRINARDITYGEAKVLMRLKQKQVLGHLFPDNPELSINFLKRVEMVDKDFKELLTLKRILSDNVLSSHLRHCGTLNLKPLAQVKPNRELAECAFFKKIILGQILDKGLIKAIKYTFYDCLRLAEILGKNAPMQALKKCSDYTQLIRLHSHWAKEVTDEHRLKHYLKQNSSERLAIPPASGNSSIVPITTATGLYDESKRMETCVFSYLHEAAAGRISIYKILWPERGTLSLRKDSAGYTLDEFSLHQNAEPSPFSKRYVSAWLDMINHRFMRASPRALHPYHPT